MSEKLNSGIYQIKNLVTNKVYIGSAKNFNERFAKHKRLLKNKKHPNIKLQSSYDKHGVGNFIYEKLELVEVELLIINEQKWLNNILKANTDSKFFKNNGYNLSKVAGSTLGYKFSEESKIKMSNSKLKSNSEYHKFIKEKSINCEKDFYKIENDEMITTDLDKSNPFYGKKHSNETKIEMSNQKKGNKNPHFGKGPMLGKVMTDSHKNKIGVANSGKNNKKSKPVLQYDLEMNLINEWDSAGIAAKTLKLSVGNLWMCCNGKARTSYGFIWRYKNK